MGNFRSTTVTTTSTNIRTIGTDVQSVNIVNRHNAIIYVKFYNQTVATFQDTPFFTFQVAATSTLFQAANYRTLFGTTVGLSVRVTTGVNDNDNTAASTLPIIEVNYNG